jgi:hypothetical protein
MQFIIEKKVRKSNLLDRSALKDSKEIYLYFSDFSTNLHKLWDFKQISRI